MSTGKLAQTLAYGAHMIRLRGDFDDCLELAREASRAARRLPRQLAQPVPRRRPEDDRPRAAPAARLGGARLDRAACRQPRQHRRVREGAARGARARADRSRPAAARRPGGGCGPLRRRLLRRLRDAPSRARRDGGDRDPDRRPRLVGSRGRRHPILEWPRRRRERCGDLRREAGDRQLRRRLRARQRRERGRRARAGRARHHRATASASSRCSRVIC